MWGHQNSNCVSAHTQVVVTLYGDTLFIYLSVFLTEDGSDLKQYRWSNREQELWDTRTVSGHGCFCQWQAFVRVYGLILCPQVNVLLNRSPSGSSETNNRCCSRTDTNQTIKRHFSTENTWKMMLKGADMQRKELPTQSLCSNAAWMHRHHPKGD